MWLFKKTSPRRNQVRKNITANRFEWISKFVRADVIYSALIWLLFVVTCTLLLVLQLIQQARYLELVATAIIVMLISLAAGFYICYFQKRITQNHIRALILVSLFILLLATTKIGVLLFNQTSWATATAVIAAIILTIAYDQRFAIGMSMVYCFLAYFAAEAKTIDLFLVMTAGTTTCCFLLREIRTRMKLLEVSTVAAVIVFIMAACLDFLAGKKILDNAPYHAGITLVVGVLIQGLLPLIEKSFRIATSMTLLDYSDANQPLLKRLAMEAPGTFSHSLLIGSIAEAAAEAIHRNGLLCRVGSYYHDIGKINKPSYFVENEKGLVSRHKEISPAMSQLVIVGHVKDGIEMAKEYGLPAVLRQFIEMHHGTTVVEYFYNEARKKYDENHPPGTQPPSDSDFRYVGPKPRTKEIAIVMLADAVEGAIRSLTEVTSVRIETVVHNMAMKRLQDGQFDECDLTLRELSLIEKSISKTLSGHYHSRIAYPDSPEAPNGATSQNEDETESTEKTQSKNEETKQKTNQES